MPLLPHNFNIVSVSTVYLPSSKVTIYVRLGVTFSMAGEVVTQNTGWRFVCLFRVKTRSNTPMKIGRKETKHL